MNNRSEPSPARAIARARSALLDGVARDVKYACRQLLRAPLAALTIVVTVGLGLGLVAAVYTILNAMVFRVDEVLNPHELFSVERQRSAIAEPETFTHAQYEALLRETEVFSDAFATTADTSVWIEGVRREGRLVTGNFFTVLGVGAVLGRALAPSDDEPGRPPVLVLSHRSWEQHYDSDPAVLGRPRSCWGRWPRAGRRARGARRRHHRARARSTRWPRPRGRSACRRRSRRR
jgi:macrolide transport system ATP-binding/permease protein